ncbi:putative cytochrome p450 protein [Neofusicoccum parvum]|uniref:Cytochrome p450 protein n=1 Tax=Neofusicoccum parvum TaxID=310453 RepID=A0ACB5SFW4_9PEZI|nr:putative cytochrome p450 protein [Neofusicoccum parvum]GME52804.1 putative cytochrome p450 protein [Neofusicoccum parvum]
MFRGDSLQWVNSIHRNYGEVVRLGPDRLSYTAPAAWKEIYGHKTANRKANPKDTRFLKGEANGFNSLLTEPDDTEHGAQRRIFAHAFSDRALGQQEDLIKRYVDDLIQLMFRAISKDPSGTAELDAVRLYNFTTFDIMGDLTFSEPLGNLENSEYSPWVHAIFDSFKAITLIRQLNEYPLLQKIWMAVMPIGLTYLLLKNPDKYKRLVDEVRAFRNESELTIDTVRHMKYLVACIEEALRMYPPVPLGAFREVAQGGNEILGEYLPEKTRLAVIHWSAYYSPKNFKDPEAFLPERWMLDEPGFDEYHAYDKREVLQPFSYGPRNCLGKNLAYYEMRAILSRMLWNFDLELCPQSSQWINQQSWIIWSKPELMVRFTPRKI